MAYSYRSRRSIKKYAQKSKRNLLVTLILIGMLGYATFFWILPILVNGIGSIKNLLNPAKKTPVNTTEDLNLAPPVLVIPYEATNSSTVDISGYATEGIKVEVYLDDDLKQTTDPQPDGSFIAKDIELSLGTNNLYGKTTDGKKSSLASKTIKVFFDNEKPKLEVSEPEDGKKVQGERKIKIAGKTEPDAKIFINDSQVIVDKDGNFSKEIQLNDGDNNFNIKAIDEATNYTEVVKRVVFQP